MATTISIRDWTRAGAPGADLDRMFGPLYRRLLAGEPIEPLLQKLCELLVDELPAVMIAVARKLEGGTVGIEAASPHNTLWTDLQNLPERWDGAVTGRGPAALAIESGEPAWISVSEDGLRPWREAANRERVSAAGAWPVMAGGETWLLQVFRADEAFFHDGAARRQMDRFVRELKRLIDDAARLRQLELLGAALESHGHAAFITNLDGEIAWSNRAFSNLYGYSANEARGKTPRLLHSGKQGLRYYRDLWSTIRSGQVWSGETVDRDRAGTDHTVRQTVSPFGTGDRVTHYLSTHEDITALAADRERRELASKTDPGTGLLTPSRFEAAVAKAIEAGTPFALAMVSLRGYEQATAGLAPELIEAVEAELGARAREVLGPDWCADRRSPGEFRLLLADEAPELSLARLTEALGQPFPMLGRPLAVQPRAGLAHFPRDANTCDTLLSFADAKLADQPIGRARRDIATD